MALFGLFFFFVFYYNLIQKMFERLTESKDSIDESAKAYIENPDTISKVLSAKSFEQLFESWSKSMIGPFQKYFEITHSIENKLQQQIRNFWIGIVTNSFIAISIYIFFYDNKDVIGTIGSVLFVLVPYYIVFTMLNYLFLQLRVINSSSIILKELSLTTAISFDYFFKNDKTKEQYNKIFKIETIENYDDHRRYLEVSLSEIAMVFIFRTELTKTIKMRSIDNLVTYQRELLKQFDSRVYLHTNYNKIFEHSQRNFK